MKILFVSQLYPNPRQPAAAAYNRQLLSALAAYCEPRVIAPVPWYARRGIADRETRDGIRVEHPAFWYPPRLARTHHWRLYRRCVQPCFDAVMRDWKPDRIMLGFIYPDTVAMAGVCQAHAIPYSVRVNGSDFRLRMRQPPFRKLVLRTLRDAPRVFCPGEMLRRDMIDAGIEPSRIIAFDNGIDHDLFYPVHPGRATPETGLVCLFVGNLQKVKGTDRLIPAFAQARMCMKSGSDIRLEIVGDGPLRRRMQRQARTLGVVQQVQFHGGLSHARVADIMRRATCLCLPSRSEGMPNVALEALACGVPVVATDAGEIPRLLRNGINGALIETQSMNERDIVAALGAALGKALTQSWDAPSIAAAMRSHTWDRAARKILRIRPQTTDCRRQTVDRPASTGSTGSDRIDGSQTDTASSGFCKKLS